MPTEREEIKISSKIKKILKTKRWTQSRLSKYLCISPQRLNNWYHDKVKPGEEWLVDRIDKLYKECTEKEQYYVNKNAK